MVPLQNKPKNTENRRNQFQKKKAMFLMVMQFSKCAREYFCQKFWVGTKELIGINVCSKSCQEIGKSF
jgi:hypothetical protein